MIRADKAVRAPINGLQNTFRNHCRRVRRVPLRQRGLHFGTHRFIADQLREHVRDFFRRRIFLVEPDGRAGFPERRRVEKLVVVRRGRQRHERGRQAHGGHFSQ